MIIDADAIARLSGWLEATDIGLLDLRGPDVAVRLIQKDGAIKQSSSANEAAVEQPSIAVVAPGVGVFLDRHPLDPHPPVDSGDEVREGDPLGFLRIGPLLIAVCAPRSGVVGEPLAAAGTPVGFGTPLFALYPYDSEETP